MVGILVLLPAAALSDTVATQNTFEAGETARAAEVNENFDAVIDAVAGNDALIASLVARIEDLEATDPVPGPQGETGPQGDTGLQGDTGQQGESGVDGLDGSDAEVLHVFDANGDDVGILAGYDNFDVWVYLEEFEAVTHVDTQDGDLKRRFNPLFWYESTNCSGLAYSDRPSRILSVRDGSGPFLYVVTDPGTTLITTQSESYLPLGDLRYCRITNPTPLPLSAVTVIDSIFPFPAPLYVAPAPAPAP